MSKRRQEEPESDSDIDVSSTDEEQDDQENQEEDEMVDVDFDYFDLSPEVDFHATKNLLRQLFGDDSKDFDLSELTDLILTENHIGTTVKTDGKESDPFSILTVLDLTSNLNKSGIKKLADYILKQTAKTTEFNLTLRNLFNTKSKFKTGLIISERMLNMPVETVPPMYKMLSEEMSKAKDGNDNYEFDYFLVISKVYQLVESNADDEVEDSHKSKKSKSQKGKVQMDYFHYEDIVLEENAMFHSYYDYNNQSQVSDSRRVFNDYGIDPKLSVILIDKKKMAKAITEMEAKFPPF